MPLTSSMEDYLEAVLIVAKPPCPHTWHHHK